jgi:hypothetical protein
MTRAVVFLTATLLFASLGLVAQNNPTGGQSASAQTAAAAPSAQTGAPAPSRRADPRQATTTAPATKGIEESARGQEPHTANSRAELPQTSTILPLLGLLGLGSLVAGLFARR